MFYIPGSIAPIFKRVAQWIGMLARFTNPPPNNAQSFVPSPH